MGATIVRRVRSDEADALRDVRLRALLDSPAAFESTIERERAFGPEVWVERTERGAGAPDSATFVADLDGELIGMAGAHLERDRPGTAYLFGMWVDPSVRRAGVGLELTRAVETWARSAGADRIRLWVIGSNDMAIAMYLRAGYAETGESKPLRGEPANLEIEMARSL